MAAPFDLSGGGFPEPDVACLDAAVGALPPSTRATVNQLAYEPSLFHSMNNELARVIAVAYVGCVDYEALIGFTAAVTTRAVEHVPCLVDAWAKIVTPEAIASSLGRPQQLGIPGTCLTGFGSGTGTDPIGCEQSHDAEVVTVTDLAAEFSTWPGAQVLRETARDRCVAALEALSGETSEYAAGWDFPIRLQWEQSHHVLTCTLVHYDYSYWTGSSGLVPTGQVTSKLLHRF